jgi:hypothetical protein
MRSVPGAVATGFRDRDHGTWVSRDPVATAPGTDSMPSADYLPLVKTLPDERCSSPNVREGVYHAKSVNVIARANAPDQVQEGAT